MSEFEQPQSPMVEFKINGEQQVMHWYNTNVFYHLDVFAEYDNILYQPNESKDEGIIIWRQHLENFDDVLEMLDDNDFPFIFSPYPSEYDRKMYDRYIAEQAEKIGEYVTKWAKEK